ncbi:MAG TPA: M1 family metallopeptidase [Acidimicrobiales bacterium]|nr:M1 family metallopeptidase [Acidimicrobiales bacterium]
MPSEDASRLPRHVEPRHYALTFRLDLDQMTFAGEERVTVLVSEPTGEIVLNAVGLTIHEAELESAEGTLLGATAEADDEAERLVVRLDSPAEPGEHLLHLSFSGTIGDKLRGIYRSGFTDEAGAACTLAATQFEPTDARRAFPCWDEPDRKATFTTTLIVDEGLAAVANSEVVERTDLGNGTVQYDFAETMVMSTYLVAFVVGPLEFTDPVDVDGVPLRVACVPGKAHLGRFALDVGAHALRFFTDYFGVRYPAGKLDLIALPDFAMGAMENLGAVTFRETLLLVDPERATRSELERVADVIAHEIAHMWFGDLVTMKWWNGIWLNEAFATFMELLCVDAFRPDWERWVSFGGSRAAAMVVDGLSSTRPIEFPVSRPEEAEGMFDVLTYQKGASVLRMLERYVGAEPFRTGIAGYIAQHAYANTETADLWDAVEKATGEPARATMDSWIYQGGYPLVTAEWDAEGGRLLLSQRRFRYLDPATGNRPEAGLRWHVPVLARASVAGTVVRRRFLFDGDLAEVDLGGEPDWVVLNESAWGFFRVRYDAELLARLRRHLDQLDALERFALVSDTWATVLVGLTPVADFLELALLFPDETDPSVWSALLGALGNLDRALHDGDRPALQAYVRHLVGPAFERLGWSPSPGEAERTRSLRATLLQALGVLGDDPGVQAQAAELHAEYLADPARVDADVAGALVPVVAATGGDEEFETFLARAGGAATPQEEVRYLYGLAGFRAGHLGERAFELARDEIRSQNAPFVIAGLLANPVVGEATWARVTRSWDQLVARFPENLVERMLEGITSLSRPELAAGVHAFLDAHPVPSRQRTIAQLRERLDIAVAFRQREAATLAATVAAAVPV